MDIKAVRKAVASIKTSLWKNSNSYSIGMMKSHFRGPGITFKEHQVYVHGDDIRFIDWKMLAKTQTPYIKTFEEDRNVEIAVIIDASTTMLNGDNGVSKLQAAIELCCLIYLLAKETNDYVTATIVTDEPIYIPKKSGDEGIVYLVAQLEDRGILTPQGKVNIEFRPNKVMSDREKSISVMKHLMRKKEIVLLSDFHDFFDTELLRKIAHNAHVHCFQLLSPLDEAQSVPYSFFAGSPQSKKGNFKKINFSSNDQILKIFEKRVKKLRVGERYLEDFIKEML